jgi:hypothetical protein
MGGAATRRLQYRHVSHTADTNDRMSSCLDCGRDVDHCHGTLVIHSDRTVECTNAACELGDLLRHVFVIDCAAVLGGCCVSEEAPDLAVAS